MENRLFFIWISHFIFTGILLQSCIGNGPSQELIPLPEHPRPDFERADWINLNDYWEFEFDGADKGE